MGSRTAFACADKIYSENQPADYVYKVVGDAVRIYKIFDDGRRQIGGFRFPGELRTAERSTASIPDQS